MKASDLKKIVANAKAVINAKSVQESDLHAKVKDGFLTVSNDIIEYSQKIEVDESLDTTIEFKGLEKIVSKTGKDKDINIKQESSNTIISIDKNRFKYISLNNENIISRFDNDDFVEKGVIGLEVIDALNQTAKFVANDDLNPRFNGIFLDSENYIVGCDSHTIKYIKAAHNIDNKIIPPIVIKLLRGEKYLVYESEKSLLFANEYEVIKIKTIDSNYAKWRTVIPNNFKTEIKCYKNELIESLHYADICTNNKTKKIKLNIDNNNLTINSEDVDFGKSYTNKINIDKKGDDSLIGFNCDFLLKCLNSINNNEISINISSPASAVVINNDTLIMPVML